MSSDQIPFNSSDGCGAFIEYAKQTGCMGNPDARKQFEQEIMEGILKTVIPDTSEEAHVRHALVTRKLGRSPNGFCPSWMEIELEKNLTGDNVRDCIAAYCIDKGVTFLANKACSYVTGGSAGGLCKLLNKYAVEPVVQYALKKIGKPIVKVVVKVAETIVSAGRAFVGWVWGWFDQKAPDWDRLVVNPTLARLNKFMPTGVTISREQIKLLN
jgi:hypothetical protein